MRSFQQIPLLLFILPLLALSQPPGDPPASQPDADEEASKLPIEKVQIKDQLFKLEIAADPKTRAKGLMGREKLEDDEGMIFVYRRAGRRSFWMKGCVMDIDLIFLTSRGQIVALHEMKPDPPRKEGESEYDFGVRLKRYPSKRMAQYGIELKPGSIKKLKLKLGEFIELDRKKLSKMAK